MQRPRFVSEPNSKWRSSTGGLVVWNPCQRRAYSYTMTLFQNAWPTNG